jgi:hypothetical protein
VQKRLQQGRSQSLGKQSDTFWIKVRAIDKCCLWQFRMLKRQHDENSIAVSRFL